MNPQLHDDIVRYIATRVCGQRLMPDAWRAAYAEALVYFALRRNAPETGWRPSGEGAPWDLENDDRIQLRVRQSAALHPPSSSKNPGKPRALSFDIHPGKKGRQTHIYVFVWHPESDPDVADHRDAEQWRFCVMPEDELPEPALEQKTQRISLTRLKTLAAGIGLKTVPYSQLAAAITRIAGVILEADLEDARLSDEIMERVRRGEERVYSSGEIWAELGLDD